MKPRANSAVSDKGICETLGKLLNQGRDLLHSGKVDGYYDLLPEIDDALTELALRSKKWRKSKKIELGTSLKRELLEKFKDIQEAACESKRLAQHSVEVTFNGLMELSQALTPKPTYTPPKRETASSQQAIILDRQA